MPSSSRRRHGRATKFIRREMRVPVNNIVKPAAVLSRGRIFGCSKDSRMVSVDGHVEQLQNHQESSDICEEHNTQTENIQQTLR